MLLNSVILALSASIDSLGVGITYGLKKTKIYFLAYIVLFFLSLTITSISISIGNVLTSFFSTNVTNKIGAILILGIGIFIIFQATLRKNKIKKAPSLKHKEYNIFIKFLGITINIIKDPLNSDIDCSNAIDFKEAIFLSLALSFDSISIGFGASSIGINGFIFPVLISFFQVIFLSIGKIIGTKINNVSNIPNNIWNIISGILLICIGIIKLV